MVLKKIGSRVLWALTVFVCLFVATSGWSSIEPAGMLTVSPVYERSCVAVRLQVAGDRALSGVRWYSNDDQVVFPKVIVSGGLNDLPPDYSSGVVVAADVSGPESAWAEVEFSQAVGSDTGTLYVIFQLPENMEGDAIGDGPGFGYAAADTNSCVYLSSNGDEWLRLMTDYRLLIDPVYTLREGGMLSLKSSAFDNEPVAEDDGVEEVIRCTELMRPYPNPFNPVVTIPLALKNSGPVRLSIYDLRGRLVKDLEYGYMEAGRYEYQWRGDNRSGQRIPSGVYFARVQADGRSMTQRLLMVK